MSKDLSILIVDDAKFSAAMIKKMLTQHGYDRIRHADSAANALAMLEEQPADMIIADWLMPEMDGLTLTQKIRQLDEQKNQYSYVLLLTAKEGDDSLLNAFKNGVDDFISKSEMNSQLIPRISAAYRIILNMQRLMVENTRLIESNTRLRQLSTIDIVSELGNRQYALKRLADTLRHVHNREGAACLILIKVGNLEEIKRKYPIKISNQLLLGFSRRLKQLVRPLDIVTRTSADLFCVITYQDNPEHCVKASFKRIHDNLNHRAFKTDMDFISVQAQTLIYSADKRKPLPDANQMLTASETIINAQGSSFEMGDALFGVANPDIS